MNGLRHWIFTYITSKLRRYHKKHKKENLLDEALLKKIDNFSGKRFDFTDSNSLYKSIPWEGITDTAVQEFIESEMSVDNECKVDVLRLRINDNSQSCKEDDLVNLQWLSIIGLVPPHSINQSLESFFSDPLPWNLVGIQLFLFYVLSMSKQGRVCTHVNWTRFFRDDFENSSLLPILKHPTLESEGFDLVLLLYNGKYIQQGNDISFFVSPAASVELHVSLQIFVEDPYNSAVRNFLLRTACSKDSFAYTTALANSLLKLTTSNDSIRIRGRNMLIELILSLDDICGICLLRRLINSCPSPSLTGLLLDILRSNVMKYSSSIDGHNTILKLAYYKGIEAEVNCEISANYDDDFLLIKSPSSSKITPYWSNVIFHWFIEETIGKAIEWGTLQLLIRYDEMMSILSLLRYACLRIAQFQITEISYIPNVKMRGIFTRIRKNLILIKEKIVDETQQGENVLSQSEMLKLEVLCSCVHLLGPLLKTILTSLRHT